VTPHSRRALAFTAGVGLLILFEELRLPLQIRSYGRWRELP
jgi:hypothetical protein